MAPEKLINSHNVRREFEDDFQTQRQSHKKVKLTQTIRRQIADELF